MAVSTTGASPTRCWRTATSFVGRRQRSSAPIHHSRLHPAPAGRTVPSTSTCAGAPPPTVPTLIGDTALPDAVELGLGRAPHELGEEVARRGAALDHRAHHLRDRELHVVGS